MSIYSVFPFLFPFQFTKNKNVNYNQKHTYTQTHHPHTIMLFVCSGSKNQKPKKKNTGTTFGDALSSFYDCVNANNVWLIFTHIFHRIQLEIFLMDVYALNIFANYTNVIAPRMKSVYFGWKTYTNKYWNIRKKNIIPKYHHYHHHRTSTINTSIYFISIKHI